MINTHFIGSYLLMKFGTEEQRRRYLPPMATGEVRAAFSLSEPEMGSDVQAIKCHARKGEDGRYEINGQKMWVTNGLRAGLVFVLVKTDPEAEPRHRGFTCFIAEKEPGASKNTGEHAGLDVPPPIRKLGYKGVESTELIFDGYRCPAENVLGGEQSGLGRGFSQMMDALEVGRVNVAARGVGIAQRALELALRYSQERHAFGKPIAQHQAIQFKLADMATQIEAARLLTMRAARLKDAGVRCDLEAGMAKLFASEAGRFCVEESFRIHGGYGYSKEYEIERLYRDAPLLLIGEGTSEIQRMVIGRKLLERHKICPGRALAARRTAHGLCARQRRRRAPDLVDCMGEHNGHEGPDRGHDHAFHRRGARARAAEADRRTRSARARRHPAVSDRAARAEDLQGRRRRREGARRDGSRLLQRDGQGREGGRLARGLPLRSGQGDRRPGDPQADRACRRAPRGAEPPAPGKARARSVIRRA